MSCERLRLFFLFIVLTTGSLMPAIAAPALADDRDADPREWEDVVAVDSRGDVAIHWAGTIDLLYFTIGEIYSVGLQDTYIFFRVGYNLSEPHDKTVIDTPADEAVDELALDVTPPDAPRFIAMNITFEVDGRLILIGLISSDYGRSWRTDAGPLVLGKDVDGHDELMFFTTLRRFGLRAGMIMQNITADAYRDDRHTDSMSGFDAMNEYPVPPPVTGLVDGRELAVPYGVEKPKDHIDWTNQQVRRVLGRQDPDVQSNPLLRTNASRVAEDPRSGRSEQAPHLIETGRERMTLRHDKEVVIAGRNRVGFVNFTVENTMEETHQHVAIIPLPPLQIGWLWNYGPAQPGPVQVVPPGERAQFQFIGYPAIAEARTLAVVPILFLSSWGGFELVYVPFIFSDKFDVERPELVETVTEPVQFVATLVNDQDPFRVNEPREILLQVRDQNGVYQSGLTQIRAFVYHFGSPPSEEAYALTPKPFMEGVYKLPFTFDKPGAWIVDLHFYDLPANAQGVVPSIDFKVRVHYPRESPEIVPLPLALGGIGLGLVGLAVKERVSKNR